nr:TetR/AcrR family transcriptional regulator [Mycobacterium sp.]
MNRERILRAARAALAESGDAPLNAIARQAGIGQGTLYRHFGSREELVLAVHRADVGDLVDLAPRLLAQRPPLDALRAWLESLADYGRLKHGLSGAMYVATREQLHQEGYTPIVDAMTMLLGAGQAAHLLRPDVDGEDLLVLVGFLWRTAPRPDWQDHNRRLLDVVIDGLRVHPAS